MRTSTLKCLLLGHIAATIACTCVFSSELPLRTRKVKARTTSSTSDLRSLYEEGSFGETGYRMMKPVDYDAERSYPLVLSLHGAGGRGKNNYSQLRFWNQVMATRDWRTEHPCFVLAPQSEGPWYMKEDWENLSDEELLSLSRVHRRVDSIYKAKQKLGTIPGGGLDKALAILNEVLDKYNVDRTRIYIIGASMGGFGVWNAIANRPGMFAAAVPVCGGWPELKSPRTVKDIPIWCFHGGKDRVVKPGHSRSIFDRLTKANGNMKYTEFTNTGHSAWIPAFTFKGDNTVPGAVTKYAGDRCDRTSDVWEWLFRQKR